MNSYFHSETQDLDFLKTHLKDLIKVQSFCKRVLYRLRYLRNLKDQKSIYFYFSQNENRFFLVPSSRLPSYRESVSQKVYKSGGVYSGEMRGGFRDGEGLMEWKDGAKYEGNFSFGQPFGLGVFTYPDGDVFRGHWGYYYAKCADSEITGMGVILWKESVREGYKWLWCKKAIGLNSPRSITITPRNEEKLQETQCRYLELKHVFEVKSAQVSTVVNEVKHRYRDGSLYVGDMDATNCKRHGVGSLLWPDGDVYQGEWKEDLQNGWSRNKWSEGSCYVGFFFNNLKEGIGMYTWGDGAEYLGEWKANKMNGIGRYKWADQKAYLGEWHDGNMQGFGVLMWKDGRRYEGTWFMGKKHGEGVTYYSNGRLSRDIWRHGKIIKPDV